MRRMSSNPASSVARKASNSHAFETTARAGYAVNGLLHILIGAIAIGVAAGVGGEADQSGALGALASAPGGQFILWVVVVGLAALGIWQILSAFAGRRSAGRSKGRARTIASALGQGIIYLAVAATALTFALGGSKSSASSTTTFSATLLSNPGGVILLVLLGLGILAGGVFFVYRGVTKKFTEKIRVPAGSAGRAVVMLGRVGYTAKGIAIAVVGVLFVVAALTSDTAKASGLDGALKALKDLPFGQVILVVVGLGVIAYGLYCFARARLAKL